MVQALSCAKSAHLVVDEYVCLLVLGPLDRGIDVWQHRRSSASLVQPLLHVDSGSAAALQVLEYLLPFIKPLS